MKKLILILLTFVSLTTFAQNSNNYKLRFEKGKYIFPEMNNGTYTTRDSKQQKSFYPDGLINTFDIKWANDSVFTLTFVESNRPNSPGFLKGDEIIVWITSSIENCYTCSTYFKGQKSQEIKMCKIE